MKFFLHKNSNIFAVKNKSSPIGSPNFKVRQGKEGIKGNTRKKKSEIRIGRELKTQRAALNRFAKQKVFISPKKCEK